MVDLPAPERPTKAKTWPRRSTKLMSERAGRPPPWYEKDTRSNFSASLNFVNGSSPERR